MLHHLPYVETKRRSQQVLVLTIIDIMTGFYTPILAYYLWWVLYPIYGLGTLQKGFCTHGRVLYPQCRGLGARLDAPEDEA